MSYASDELPTGLTAVTSLGANDLFIIQVDGETIVKGVKQSDVFKNIAQSAITNLVSDLAAKQATITGAATTITSSDLTINRALVSDGSGKVAISTVTSTELGYLSGVSSALQTQIDGKQTLDSDLTSIAGLSPVNDDIIQRKAGSWTNRTIDQFTTDLALVVADITDFPTIVSQAEAEAGVATTARLWTAERVAQAISALETGGGSTTLSGLTDTDITTPATGHLIIYDGTDSWDNKAVSGDITINASGVTAIGSGVIVNADINSAAAIVYSKLSLTGAILNSDLAGSIALSKLSITGTPDGTKFLRDDATWQTIPGGGDALTTNPLSQFAATTSSQLAGVISDETGSGALVFGTSPTIVTPVLTLKQSTTPTPTAEGAIEWDTDNNRIAIGDGASTKVFSDDTQLAAASHTHVEADIIDLGSYLEDVTNSALLDGRFWIGDGTNLAQELAISGDITIANNGVASIESGVIVDADINASASIALSKLAAMTINRLVVTDASGFLSASTVTNTEAGYLSGVSSAIQTQIDGKLANIVEDITPQLGGALDGQGNDLNNLGVMFLTEQAAAEADVAGKGQIWVKTVTPNQLWFTDDAGNDKRLDTDTLTIPFEIYEGGSVISASTKILGVRLPFGYTITRATLFADASGSVTVQILTATPGSSPTFTDISNGGISLSSSDYVTDTTLTGWTTAVAADKLIQCKVTGTPATITHLSVSLEAKRT